MKVIQVNISKERAGDDGNARQIFSEIQLMNQGEFLVCQS